MTVSSTFVSDVMADARETQFLALVREHGAAIRRLAFAYERDAARQQDLVQDIWMALWQALPAFRGECSERTLVFRIAHNRAVTHIKHWRRRRTEALDADMPVRDRAADPERALTDRERQDRLRAAVQALPLGLRQVVVLTLEGLSNREAGEVLGISENNVAVRLTRARSALARRLGSRS